MPIWCRAYDCEDPGAPIQKSSRDVEDPDEAVAYCRELVSRYPRGRYVVKVQMLQSVPDEHLTRFQQQAAELGIMLEEANPF